MNIDDLSTVSCQSCGVYDASLRASSHPTVVSVLVTAAQSANAGIFCARCRAIESVKATAITLLAGWWSLRGPALTIAAIRANIDGGEQNATTNAQMLRGLAQLEYANRNPEFAAMFARAAHVVQPQRENSRLIDELGRRGHRNALPDSMWRFAPFAPLVVFALVLGVVGLRVIKGSGTAAPDVAEPVQRASLASKPLPVQRQFRNNEDLSGTADELEQRLTPDSSEALARAYFRARLSEARSQIPSRVRHGDDLMAIEGSIMGFGQQPALATLLAKPAIRAAYDQLTTTINEATRYYHGGAPVDAIERTAGESLDVTLNMTIEAVDSDMRGHSQRAEALVTDADKRLASIEEMRNDLHLRAVVISTTTRAIDTCLNVSSRN